MKIAVASTGDKITDSVSPVTGRAEFYLIFEDKKLIKTIKNPFQYGGGGAGFSVAQMLGNEGVKLIISGKFGPNVKMFCDQKSIKTKEVTDKSVEEALNEI